MRLDPAGDTTSIFPVAPVVSRCANAPRLNCGVVILMLFSLLIIAELPTVARGDAVMVKSRTEWTTLPLPTVTADALSIPEEPSWKLSVPLMVAEPDTVTVELVVTFSITLAGRTMVVKPPPGRLAVASVKLPPTACPLGFSVKLWLNELYD